ncbi:hypothetical protein HC931_13430 [Candidatus Gracilibacteria bacterium]|nr:hypothetical protein [Candidatus Gracilibacteria bacterium]NJM87322.1 hypothetical protein [Hydrococcus sp. RU_2_2]NJP19879.1 hypothetical protein [Hydrococcus sp. CRU_1_1]
MSKNAMNCQKSSLNPNFFTKKSKILAFLTYLLSLTLSVSEASAVTARLGIIKTKENSPQWTEIAKRLQATGVDYCIVDASQWQDEYAFGSVGVLLLPNVEDIDQLQALSLERWISQGGRAIVTGPTGNLSLPEVKERLRPLFGAYWAFSNSFPIAIEVIGSQLSPTGQPGVISTLVGGVIRPVGTDSQTEAIWLTDERLPAVVASERATYLGWRWGMEGVAGVAFDAAWLESALNRYGIGRYNNNNVSLQEPTQPGACQESNPRVPSLRPQPLLPQTQQERTF